MSKPKSFIFITRENKKPETEKMMTKGSKKMTQNVDKRENRIFLG